MTVTRKQTVDDRRDAMRRQMHIPTTTAQHIRFFLHWVYTLWLTTGPLFMVNFNELHEVLLQDEPGIGVYRMLLLIYTDIQNQYTLTHRHCYSQSYLNFLRVMRKIVLDEAGLLGEDWVPV